MATVQLGTVSHGTMRDADLVETFGSLLAELDTDNAYAALRASAERWTEHEPETDDERADLGETVAELFLALDTFAPTYCYFGAHEGDGADYGFWPSWDSLDDSAHDGDLLQVADLSEVPDGYAGDVQVTNDHGNVSVGHVRNGAFAPYWECV